MTVVPPSRYPPTISVHEWPILVGFTDVGASLQRTVICWLRYPHHRSAWSGPLSFHHAGMQCPGKGLDRVRFGKVRHAPHTR